MAYFKFKMVTEKLQYGLRVQQTKVSTKLQNFAFPVPPI